jgi:hypothetical protein
MIRMLIVGYLTMLGCDSVSVTGTTTSGRIRCCAGARAVHRQRGRSPALEDGPHGVGGEVGDAQPGHAVVFAVIGCLGGVRLAHTRRAVAFAAARESATGPTRRFAAMQRCVRFPGSHPKPPASDQTGPLGPERATGQGSTRQRGLVVPKRRFTAAQRCVCSQGKSDIGLPKPVPPPLTP